MMMQAVLAVALGIAPIKDSGSAQLVQVDLREFAMHVSGYQQLSDSAGNTHLTGFDRAGNAFDLTVDKAGRVSGTAGDYYVTFNVADPS